MRPPAHELTLEQFLLAYPRIAGAETPPAAPPKPEDPPAPPPDPPAPADPPAPKPEEAETVTMTKAEADALRRKVAEAEKQRRQAEKDAREREEERQRQQGEYQQLAEQKAREAQDLRDQLTTAERNRRVSRIATSLDFHDPDDVLHRLTPEEADDETLATQALERIAKSSPHLVKGKEKPKPQIGQVLEPGAGDPGPSTPGGRQRTKEDYERMTADELAALPDQEYQKALRLMKG